MTNTISASRRAQDDARQATAALSPHLLPGETIAWSGRPKQGLAFTSQDMLLIPFSLLWLGMIGWIAYGFRQGSARSTEDLVFSLIPTLMFIVGLYIVFGRHLTDALHRRSLHYAVTDQRVIIVSRFPFKSVTSLARNSNLPLALSQYGDDTATLSFGGPKPWLAILNGIDGWHACLGRGPLFFRIPDAATVFHLLQPPAGR